MASEAECDTERLAALGQGDCRQLFPRRGLKLRLSTVVRNGAKRARIAGMTAVMVLARSTPKFYLMRTFIRDIDNIQRRHRHPEHRCWSHERTGGLARLNRSGRRRFLAAEGYCPVRRFCSLDSPFLTHRQQSSATRPTLFSPACNFSRSTARVLLNRPHQKLGRHR